MWALAFLAMQMPGMPGMAGHEHGHATGAADFLMRQSSGTAADPASVSKPMWRTQARGWMLMLHGLAFVSARQETGPRGQDKVFSTNWLMSMAEHGAGRGTLMFRTMLSLEPLTITHRSYPELFQTGETAYGRPLVDAQHPHNFVMELAVEYARGFGEKSTFYAYGAPIGDPALGPVAFPHRESASEIPQAPLAHHLQDSTHISYEVVTAGVERGIVRVEASGFHGAEPSENRWTIGYGSIDSWSARIWLTPSANWAGQVSLGRLSKPEALEPGDIVRSTASVTYNRPLARGSWATSAIWGRNHKTALQRNLNSYLLETVLPLTPSNHVTGRFELVEKDELTVADGVFRVAAYTAGYMRNLHVIPKLATGIGANFTVYGITSRLKPYYGARPAAFIIFVRFRPAPSHVSRRL